jgi:hypothetical protein
MLQFGICGMLGKKFSEKKVSYVHFRDDCMFQLVSKINVPFLSDYNNRNLKQEAFIHYENGSLQLLRKRSSECEHRHGDVMYPCGLHSEDWRIQIHVIFLPLQSTI